MTRDDPLKELAVSVAVGLEIIGRGLRRWAGQELDTTAENAAVGEDAVPNSQASTPLPPTDKQVLTMKEAAEMLRVSSSSLYTLVQKGEIRCIQIGSRRLIPTVELQDFVERKLREHGAPRT